MEPARPDPPQPARDVPLALELSLAVPPAPAVQRNRASTKPKLLARLVRPGHAGWVGGQMSWSRLQTSYYFSGCRASHLQLVQELYALHISRSGAPSYYSTRDDKTIDLAAFDSRRLWPLLDEAAEIGLQLVHARKRLGPIERYGQAELCLDVSTGADPGALTVAPVLQIDGRSGDDRGDEVPVLFIGAQGHGVVLVSRTQAQSNDPADWSLRLAKLATPAASPLQRMILDDQRIPIPAGQRSRFRDEFYPRLRRLAPVRSSDGSFTPPAISGPTLVLRAAYGDDHDLALSWEWAYEVGDTKKRLPLASGVDDDIRDPVGERAVLDTLDVPLERLGLRGDGPAQELAPLARLTGLDTMRFSTEVLPLLADAPDVVIEVSGDAADYREAGDSLQIGVSTGEVTGETDWFDLGVSDHRRGTRGAVRRGVPGAGRGRVAPAAARRRVLLPPEARAAGVAHADRGGARAAGPDRRPAADQPVPGGPVGGAGRTRRRRAPGTGVAAAGRGPAVARPAHRHRAARDPVRAAAPLPARGIRLAVLPLAPPARRHPRRRHGSRQDAAVARADLPRQAG